MKKKIIFILLVILLVYLSIGTLDYISNQFTPADELSDNDETIDPIDDNDQDDDEIIVEEPDPEPIEINILAVGDIMFHQPQINSGRIGEGQYDFNPVFKYVKPYIQEADLSLGNYETVSLPDRSYSGYPMFNSPPETIQALKESGFDILSTANNHSLDQGKTGIISTIGFIEEYGLDYVGTSLDRESGPLIVDVEGIEIGLLSYTYGLNGLDSFLTSDELSYMVNLIDEEKIQSNIEDLKDHGVDLIISYIHWGNEYQHQPTEYQQDLGRKMVEWGANIVFGSHPHVLQKSEIIDHNGKDNFIVYSMGNFISNQREITMGNSYSEDGIMISLDIEKDLMTEETIIKDINYIPTWVYRYGDSSKYHYEILPVKDVLDGKFDLNLDGSIMQRIEKSYNDAVDVYGIDLGMGGD